MTIEINEEQADAILWGLGWADSEGATHENMMEVVEIIIKAFPSLRDEHKCLTGD